MVILCLVTSITYATNSSFDPSPFPGRSAFVGGRPRGPTAGFGGGDQGPHPRSRGGPEREPRRPEVLGAHADLQGPVRHRRVSRRGRRSLTVVCPFGFFGFVLLCRVVPSSILGTRHGAGGRRPVQLIR